jgi:Domain of unknown function (DUF1793)
LLVDQHVTTALTGEPALSSDLYDTIKDQQVGFQARPVQGGIFALLTLGSGRA